MSSDNESNLSVGSQPGWGWRVLQFPLTRIVVALGAIAAYFVAVLLAVKALGLDSKRAGIQLVLAAGVYLIYFGFVRLVERRSVTELSRDGAARGLGGGFALGAAMFSLVILILWTSGVYGVTDVHGIRVLGAPLVASIAAALLEETVVRGILFRIVEEGVGTWLALALSAAVFGLLHAFNPGATWIDTLAIALEAGVLLAAAYVYSRKLWLCFGLHCGWNFTEGGIFGASVSGGKARGLLVAHLQGPTALTGGRFGPEGSAVAVAVGLGVGLTFLVFAARRKRILRPAWHEKVSSAASGEGRP